MDRQHVTSDDFTNLLAQVCDYGLPKIDQVLGAFRVEIRLIHVGQQCYDLFEHGPVLQVILENAD